MPERRVGWQPSWFLADHGEAERAFALAERLGSVNAAAAELGATWPPLRKAFTRHVALNPAPSQPARVTGGAVSGGPRDEQYAILGASAVVELYSKATPASGNHPRRRTTPPTPAGPRQACTLPATCAKRLKHQPASIWAGGRAWAVPMW
jgi:hypothetical protein